MVTLAVILRGEKRVEFPGVSFAYRPGSFLFVTGEQSYISTISEASAAAPYLSMALQLPPEALHEVLLDLEDAGCQVEAGEDEDALLGRIQPQMLDALRRLVGCLDDPVSCRVLAPILVRELIVHLLRSASGGVLRRAAAQDDGRIRRAVAFIDSHASERLTVSQMARHVRMSPSHFAHRFREVVRMSPIQYVKHVRLQKARLLMLGEGLGAAEAGSVVGYASASHFARDFRSYFGSPPATYVSKLRAAG